MVVFFVVGELVGKLGDLGFFLGEGLAVLVFVLGLLGGKFAFGLRLGLGEAFMHFGLEFLGADLVEDVSVAGFVDGEGGVAVGAFDFVHFGGRGSGWG